jgi:hypothetical protein
MRVCRERAACPATTHAPMTVVDRGGERMGAPDNGAAKASTGRHNRPIC